MKRGVCTHCKQTVLLRPDGRVVTHDYPKPCRVVCPGSGDYPQDDPLPKPPTYRKTRHLVLLEVVKECDDEPMTGEQMEAWIGEHFNGCDYGTVRVLRAELHK